MWNSSESLLVHLKIRIFPTLSKLWLIICVLKTVLFYSNVEGDAGNLELGQEVEYTLASRTGPGGKVSAENVRLLTKGTLPMPKVSVMCFIFGVFG